MTDQQNSESNQEKESVLEENVQSAMMAQGTENPGQPPIVEQD